MTDLPSVDYLFQRLDINATTGDLWWRHCDAMPKKWNTRYAGKRAFTTKHSDGYLQGSLDRRCLRAHRVIWAMVFGTWPPEDIDHINGIRTDNRIVNLRATSRLENSKNQGLRKTNVSGCMGVQQRGRRWRAYLSGVHLGTFDTLQEAIVARQEAEKSWGFHENHGSQRPSY